MLIKNSSAGKQVFLQGRLTSSVLLKTCTSAHLINTDWCLELILNFPSGSIRIIRDLFWMEIFVVSVEEFQLFRHFHFCDLDTYEEAIRFSIHINYRFLWRSSVCRRYLKTDDRLLFLNLLMTRWYILIFSSSIT